MNMEYTHISFQGVSVRVPSARIDGKTIVVTGKWIKSAEIKDEDWQEGELVRDPALFIAELRDFTGAKTDLFTFGQKITDPIRHFPYHCEWQSIAAIPIPSFNAWWESLCSDARKDVRRAAKRGVTVRAVPFTDEFVRSIKTIYDETPIRQGRTFWHYKKDVETVRVENETYSDRSDFLGAFCGDELIGFAKIVYVGSVARLMQIIGKDEHRDKRPMNALIAKAVEIACAKGYTHLTYGKYRYPQGIDGITAFKHRNGFQEFLIPRYYVPLTAKGRFALSAGLHHGLSAWLPGPLRRFLRSVRATILHHLVEPRRGS